MNVMVLLGNHSSRSRLAGLSRGATVEFAAAEHLPEALISLKNTSFDVVLLSGLNGSTESVCRSVKQVTRAPVVAIVNWEADWNELHSLGVDGYVPMQADSPEMLARLKAISRRVSLSTPGKRVGG